MSVIIVRVRCGQEDFTIRTWVS